MKININNLPEDRFALQFEKIADAFPLLNELAREGEYVFKGPVRGDLTGSRVGTFFYVKGRLNLQVRLTCSRCLKPFDSRLDSKFELTYTREPAPVDEAPEKQEVEISAEDAGMVWFEGDEIDFAGALQEQIVMSLPFRPLCRKACKGLCPQCGADLNAGDCGCRRIAGDGPFAALAGLKFKDT